MKFLFLCVVVVTFLPVGIVNADESNITQTATIDQEIEIDNQSHESTSCCICWELFSDVERVVLHPCSHDTCIDCAHQWFFKYDKKTCPVCYKKVRQIGQQDIVFHAPDPRYFSEKIEDYLHQIANQASRISPLKESAQVLWADTTFDKPIQLRKYVSQITEQLAKEPGIASERSLDIQDEVHVAFLLKTSKYMSRFMRNALVDILDTLNKHIAYWERQSKSPISYFFHKAPHKWFSGKRQREETHENVFFLKKLEKKYFDLLGRLNNHLNQFDIGVLITDHYSWLDGLIDLGKEFIEKDSWASNNTVSTFDSISADMQTILTGMCKYEKRLKHEIGRQAALPHHIIRHWIFYSTATTGILYCMWYADKNPRRVQSWTRMLRIVTKNIWRKSIYPGYKNIKDFFLGRETQENNQNRAQVQNINPDEIRQLADDIERNLNRAVGALQNNNPQQGNQLGANLQNLVDPEARAELVSSYQFTIQSCMPMVNDLRNNFTPAEMQQLQLDSLAQNLQNNRFVHNAAQELQLDLVKKLRTIYAHLLPKGSNLNISRKIDIGSHYAELIHLQIDIMEHGARGVANEFATALHGARGVANEFVAALNDVTVPLSRVITIVLNSIIGQMLPDAKRLLLKVDDIMFQNKLTIGAIYLIPFVGALYGLTRGIRRCFHYDYKPTQLILEDIQRILNKYMIELNFENEGRVVYLIQKMKGKVVNMPRYIVPADKKRLLDDIRELESPMTIAQKLTALERIRRTIKRLFR